MDNAHNGHPSPGMTSPTPALRALLLEDNSFDAELTIETLRRTPGSTVTHVTNGEGFRRALEKPDFNIILSDFSIPGFSGTEALELSLAKCPNTPFVFISGVLGEEHAVEMLKRGATDYVVKSRLSRLPLVVNRAIAESRERAQRQHAERALRNTEHTLARVVDSLQDYAVVLLSPTGEIQSWTRAAEGIFGYTFDEVRGRSAEIFFRREDRAVEAFHTNLERARQRGSTGDDRWLVRADGSETFINSVITAFVGDDDALSGFSWIARDTTSARRAAESLQTAKLEAERASQAKDRFIAVLSHELRTPLVPIMTGAQILAMDESITPRMQSVVEMIQRNVALEARLIDDLLDVTGIERGKVSIDTVETDAHEAIRGALETVEDEIARKNLRLSLNFHARDVTVMGDLARLQQIIWNLVRNAVKFTRSGGRIAVTTANPAPGTLVVTVSDDGVGMNSETLPRIFTPFEQADAVRKAGFGGLGLGLAIARGLALKHGADLRGHSDGEGKGSTFTFTIPTVGSSSPDVGGVAGVAGVVAEAGPGYEIDEARARPLSILLVEDNPDAAAALSLSLELDGSDVTIAESVAKARKALAEGTFDVLVSDIGLPDGTGRDVVEAVGGRFPAIALSGYGMEEDVRASLEAGFIAHLIKPVDSRRLRAAMAQAVAGA